MKKLRVALISTLNHNVGDDFVREGILHLLRQIAPSLEPRVIHKHFPATARDGESHLDAALRPLQAWPPLHRLLGRVVDLRPLKPASDAILSSDLAVQCGAPVYWRNRYSSCAQTEWYRPLIERRWRRVRGCVPLLNLGAGSCQALGSDGSEVASDPACREFIRGFTKAAALTTVRDVLAAEIVRECGYSVPMLPCPSIFAPLAAGCQPEPGRYVALNYMPMGGHYDLSGHADAEDTRQNWERRFVRAAEELAAREECLLICHSELEVREAERLLPQIPRLRAFDWRSCLQAYAGCRWAFVNRVHGGVVAGAMGKPVLLIGNDTRLLTADLIPGIRTLAVTADEGDFQEAFRQVQAAEPDHAGAAAFVAETEARYLELLRPLVQP